MSGSSQASCSSGNLETTVSSSRSGAPRPLAGVNPLSDFTLLSAVSTPSCRLGRVPPLDGSGVEAGGGAEAARRKALL